MQTKLLGNSLLKISAIGMGTGDFFWNSSLNEAGKVAYLQKGIEIGINFIDTAEGYGNGASESYVAQAIQGVRDQVVIATKFSPENSSYKDVINAAENSLKRLKTDYIDLYQIHWSNPKIPLIETIHALCDLVESGKVRYLGVCNFFKKELDDARNYLGPKCITSLQTEYNLFERTIEDNGMINYCRENMISILAYSPLDQGRISNISPHHFQLLQSISQKYEKTIPQIILRWIVEHENIVAIVRSTNIKHLYQNRDVLNFNLSKSDFDAINKAFKLPIINVPVDKIYVTPDGEWSHSVYSTVEEAIENRFGFTPSPVDLAKSIKQGEFLKPVRLIRSKQKNYDYDIIAGRIRYWAWVIAYQGKKSIPAYVRENF